MGRNYGYKCRKCGKYIWFWDGVGFLFPVYYEETEEKILKGEYGQKYKEFFEVFPNAATDAESGAYECLHCGHVFNEVNLGMYLPKDDRKMIEPSDKAWSVAFSLKGRKYVTSIELESEFELFEDEQHKCCKCGMEARKIIREEIYNCKIKCRKCDEEMELIELEFWD